MLLATLALFALVRDDQVVRLEGAALLLAMAGYLFLLLWLSRRNPKVVASEIASSVPTIHASAGLGLAMILGGTAVLVLGARLLVTGAVGIAEALGVSERVVGLTVVAFGTSLPELAASLVAAVRHHTEIVFGNLIGSNIFNILLILGGTAVVEPVAAPWAALRTDLLVMLAISVLGPVLLFSGQRVSRWEGGLLLVCYAGYLALLFR